MLAIFDVEGVLYDAEYLPILAERVNKEKEISSIEITKAMNENKKVLEGKVLLLDEPYSYLDSKSVNTLNQTIGKYKESGGTIIISDNSLFVEELSPDDSFQL